MQLDPSLDVVANRLPNVFVQGRRIGEKVYVEQIGRLARGLDRTGALVIFPEGGNWTPGRWRRGIQRLERAGRGDLAERARAMPNLLAPRTGGAISAIAACPDADVIFVAHAGLDTLVTVSDIWRSLPMDQIVHAKWWRVQVDKEPRSGHHEAHERWLYDWWERIDAWISELDPMSCQAVGVDHLALAKNIRNSLSRWANPVGSMLAPKLPQTAAGVENTVQEPQDDKPIIQGTMPDLAQWRRQQEDIAIQKARDILNSRPGWAQSQLALTQAEEDFDKTLHLDSWQRALNYYRATGKAWLEIVSDNETLQAFYTILPVIMEGMYWKCLGITPDTFRATSPPAHQFEQDLRDGDKDFRKRAAERAIRGPEPTPEIGRA